MVGIYKITSPSGKIYIGQSVNILSRINKYKNAKCITQPIILKSILKYGWENHLFEIVLECDKSELNEKERYYQELFNCIGKNGLNCMLTNTSTKTGKARQETIDKLKGRKLPESTRQKMRDKKLSDETKLKISTANIGREVSKETRDKISKSNKGKVRSVECVDKMKKRVISEQELKRLSTLNIGRKASNETKLKISLAQKGKKPSDKCLLNARIATSKKVINTKTNEIYDSVTQLAIILGMNRTTLNAKLTGQTKNNTDYIYL
jgi:group I intron endonuclease